MNPPTGMSHPHQRSASHQPSRGDDPGNTVEIVEVSPRDGLQNESVVLSTEDKLELIDRAVAAGARRLEATSFVHPTRVPQMADAEAVMAGVPRRDGLVWIGLALNERGVRRALDAACDEVNYVVVASDTFSDRNQGMTSDAAMAQFVSMADAIHGDGRGASVTIAASFGCPFEGEVPVSRVVDLARQAIEAGADEIALADTIGVAVPADIHERVAAVRPVIGDVPLRLHLHDTRHTGIANAQAGIDAGVTILDASLGGIGGCPFAPAATGNIATEDLLYLLHRSGIEHGWDLATAMTVPPWLDDKLGQRTPGMLARAGNFPN